MANQNPIDDLLERLKTQFGQAPGPSVEAMVRRFFEPFALVPKADFEQQQATLTEAEATITALDARVTALEAKAAQAAKKRKKKTTNAKKAKPKG
ncbi:MAG: accessory factor UbiK family protein [Pseudomonadales bacterium]